MSFSADAADERVLGVEFSNGTLRVALRDGRTIAVPLAWYPRLLNASPTQRKNWRVAGGGYGIYWPDVDEDLSTEGLLRGAAAPTSDEVSGLGGGPLDIQLLSIGAPRPVQSSALDAASIDDLQHTA